MRKLKNVYYNANGSCLLMNIVNVNGSCVLMKIGTLLWFGTQQ